MIAASAAGEFAACCPENRERNDSAVRSRGFCGVLPGKPGKK